MVQLYAPCPAGTYGSLEHTSSHINTGGLTVTVMAHFFPFPLIHDTRQGFQTKHRNRN